VSYTWDVWNRSGIHSGLWWINLTARGQLENLFISWRIILKYVLSMLNRTMGTVFMCIMMGKLAASWKEGIELTD